MTLQVYLIRLDAPPWRRLVVWRLVGKDGERLKTKIISVSVTIDLGLIVAFLLTKTKDVLTTKKMAIADKYSTLYRLLLASGYDSGQRHSKRDKRLTTNEELLRAMLRNRRHKAKS